MVGLKHKLIGYIIQTFGAGILSLISVKFLYSLALLDGLCWTTDCEIESTGVIMIFYVIMAFINLYLILLPSSNMYPFHLSILIITLIIQMYYSTKGNNFMFATIIYGLMGILNYQIIDTNLKFKFWVTTFGGFLMLLIIGMNYLNLMDILIGYLGARFNPDNEQVIKLIINSLTIVLIFQIIGFAVYKMKKYSM